MSATASRPERSGPAERFYSAGEARRYEDNARMSAQQRALADRALQLLDLPANGPCLLLDAGCGTGYSGRPLEKAGHEWIGTDISLNMLKSGVGASASSRRGAIKVVCDDLGTGFGFRNGIFDGCISISAVQWLCHATNPSHDPPKRVKKFFTGLKAVLAGGARAVLQLYPEQPEHMQMLRDAALACGFSGGLVVDYPWSERSKKLFLVLVAPKREAAQQTWMGELVGKKAQQQQQQPPPGEPTPRAPRLPAELQHLQGKNEEPRGGKGKGGKGGGKGKGSGGKGGGGKGGKGGDGGGKGGGGKGGGGKGGGGKGIRKSGGKGNGGGGGGGKTQSRRERAE